MVTDSFKSPNAIPPRRSSTGLGGSYINPTQPVLKPVPESDWIFQSKKVPISPYPTSPEGITPGSKHSIAKHVNGTEWTQEKDRIVLGPYEYLKDHPGKDIRRQLISAFNAWLKVPEESLAIITNVVGMLHTASLL